MKVIERVCIVGRGNVAWHYEKLFTQKGFSCCVVSPRGTLAPICFEADLVIIAVKDEAIAEVAQKLKGMRGLLVHTSGFVSTDCLQSAESGAYGSLYPLQTLKKGKETDYNTLPLCTYGNNEKVRKQLGELALQLSNLHYELSDEQRKTLHLAAVFCNNFPNHLFGIARKLLQKDDIPFSILFPLLDATLERAKQFDPFSIQTGPAFRKEHEIMRQHKERLSQDEREIYEILSEKIIKKHTENI
ncbi:MAG: DUF2520 domain-containing protein [Candidatus Onthomorpha sp.]|nr:DUF2520 domain-containing protein [Candidatus Onthomorpha sp.]